MNSASKIEQTEARPLWPGFSLAPMGSPLGWAIYLGISWTWCIGMFLPVLLIRDYGIRAWWIFTIPNVIGAAAMGWVLRRTDFSRRLVDSHSQALTLFSLVTIAFHVFFLLWVGKLLLPPQMLWIAVPVAGLCALLGARRAIYWMAGLVLIGSLALLVLGFQKSEIPYVATNGSMSVTQAVALASVCLFGFGLCPYLDLTFHRALQFTRAPLLSFTLGFGVFFLSMIVFTLFYSGWMDQIISDRARPPIMLAILGWHVLLQSAFTAGIHAREVVHRLNWRLIAVFAVCLIAPIAPRWVFERSWGYNLDEPIYRIFMGFYGLIFPAYVWVCMIPGRGRLKPTRRQLTVFAGAVLIALPMFWMGFIARQLVWLLPGVGVVLLARLFIRGTGFQPVHGLETHATNKSVTSLAP